MPAEPFPVDLIWASKRRTREIVELHEARKSGLRMTGRIATPAIPLFPSGEVTFEGAGTRTVPDYAVRATECVRHETGTLERPDRFIRMTLNYAHIATWELPFGWPDNSQQRVSTLYTTELVRGIGRVFVALFGSPHNILANMEPEEYLTGRVPSSAHGLYRIIDAMREPGEVQLRPEVVTEERFLNDVDAEYMASLAAGVVYGLHDPLPAQRLEVLAEPRSIAYNHTVGRRRAMVTPGPSK